MVNIKIKESETIEFKESLSELKGGAETLCGFTNKKGGILYFGIKNDGTIIGITNITPKTLIDISQYIYDNFDPRKIFEIDEEKIEGLSVIKITIEKSATPYHTFRKKPFIRIGSSTRPMPYEEYQDRLLRYKSSANTDYSAVIVNKSKITDLSYEALKELRKLLSASGRYDVNINKLSDEQLLKDLLLLRDNQLTVAALILLGTENALSNYFPYAEIRYGYKVNEGEIRNQDTYIFKGGYLTYYNKIWDKIQSRNITLNIPYGLRLVERKTFDEQSIREAINNAVVHRDYFVQETSFIIQYPTKIFFKNAGGFPEGITIENIMFESKPRNKLLADILFKCELVEQFGNGVNLMYKNQVSLGKQPPNYNETSDDRVILELDGSIQDIEFAKYVLMVADKQNKYLNDLELLILNTIKNGEKVEPDKMLKGLLDLGLVEKIGFNRYMLSKQYYLDINKKGKYTKTKGLSKRENKELIIAHLKEFDSAMISDFSQVFDRLSRKQIWSLLNELRDEKIIYFDGKMRSTTGRWKLIK